MADKPIVSADEQLLADTEYLLNQKKSRRLIKTSLAEVTPLLLAPRAVALLLRSFSFVSTLERVHSLTNPNSKPT